MAMTQRQALQVLAAHRGDKVVITTMTAVGIWPELSDTALHYIGGLLRHARGRNGRQHSNHPGMI